MFIDEEGKVGSDEDDVLLQINWSTIWVSNSFVIVSSFMSSFCSSSSAASPCKAIIVMKMMWWQQTLTPYFLKSLQSHLGMLQILVVTFACFDT